MQVTIGSRLGPYEIVSRLGAGGMGEVFEARDSRLERRVAVKILTQDFARDERLRARFQREAKTISQLNHPHICSLYDIGHEDGTDFLVMELIEGETLAGRILRGPLPVEQALRYGIEIAEALEKAHSAGVVHRDLKPGNVMITKSGAKLLDFGLAKSGTVAISDDSATALQPLTEQGVVVGTLQYMAPEQIAGAEADARTDIFALGLLLYEMVTGRRAFEGKTRTSLVAAIVSGQPVPVSQIQRVVPAALEYLIGRCLAKEPDQRWQCPADLKWELLRIRDEPAITQAENAPRRSSRVAWSVALVALLATAVLAAIVLRPDKAARPVRFFIPSPPGRTGSIDLNVGPPAVSPDGRYVAFPAKDDGTGRIQIWVRDLASTEPFALGSTEGAGFLFWSPDSRSIGFFADGYLKRTDVNGGVPQALCPAAVGRGGSWSKYNEIIFAPSADGPLLRVGAAGGAPQQLTQLDHSRGDTSHRWPYFLPDGKHFLYLIRSPWSRDRPGDETYVADIDSPAPRLVLNASSNVAYAGPAICCTCAIERCWHSGSTSGLCGWKARRTPSLASHCNITQRASASSAVRGRAFSHWAPDRSRPGFNGSTAAASGRRQSPRRRITHPYA